MSDQACTCEAFRESELRVDALIRERDRLVEIIDMAWRGYGYDEDWECDCRVCAAIRTRTPHGVVPEGGDDGS